MQVLCAGCLHTYIFCVDAILNLLFDLQCFKPKLVIRKVLQRLLQLQHFRDCLTKSFFLLIKKISLKCIMQSYMIKSTLIFSTQLRISGSKMEPAKINSKTQSFSGTRNNNDNNLKLECFILLSARTVRRRIGSITRLRKIDIRKH